MEIRDIIVISDLHIGCQLGLCIPEPFQLDNGGYYQPSNLQLKLWEMWKYFWEEWVREVVGNRPFAVVNNGDCIDGSHHRASTVITDNIEVQAKLAVEILTPIVNMCDGNYYHIRGTSSHVGESGRWEEWIARQIGAIPDDKDNHARWDLWLRLGSQLIHFSHHIGTTSSSSYESTAVYKEMVEAFNESGRWGMDPPDCIVRSHRHRQFETRIASEKGCSISLVTPGWQLKTPYVYRLSSGRASTPQIGGYWIYLREDGSLDARFKIWKIGRSREELL